MVSTSPQNIWPFSSFIPKSKLQDDQTHVIVECAGSLRVVHNIASSEEFAIRLDPFLKDSLRMWTNEGQRSRLACTTLVHTFDGKGDHTLPSIHSPSKSVFLDPPELALTFRP